MILFPVLLTVIVATVYRPPPLTNTEKVSQHHYGCWSIDVERIIDGPSGYRSVHMFLLCDLPVTCLAEDASQITWSPESGVECQGDICCYYY